MSLSSRVKVCYVNFILLLVAGALMYMSGFVLWLVLPRGRASSRFSADNTFLGLDRSSWEDIHIVVGFSLLALTIIHLMLNWTWIRNVTRHLISSPKVST